MGVRTVLVAAVVILGFAAVGIGNAAPWAHDELVEGHTVFLSLGNVTDATGRIETAAALAVLVREHQGDKPLMRFPGVLWFNDQYLTSPVAPGAASATVRHPCTGAVLAVERGNPSPLDFVYALERWEYVESYHVTDPNDREWDVDKWVVLDPLGEFFVWSVAINNAAGASMTPDDGTSACEPVRDQGCPTPLGATTCSRPSLIESPSPDEAMRCLSPGACEQLRYNAVLFFRMGDFATSGAPRNHSKGADEGSVSGCQPGTEWACPADDDDREGDSHPYIPRLLQDPTEGYSADCTGDGDVDKHCHRTVDIDIYFGIAPAPVMREYWIDDRVGSEAAYGCHLSDGPLCGVVSPL